MTVERHRTALTRSTLSRPARLLLEHGLMSEASTILDYGCGRGGDVDRLSAAGIAATGWDPYFRPAPGPRDADIVMLNFVLNVIEDADERAETLRRAWALAQRLLVIAVRTVAERSRLEGRAYADGRLTRRNTFHRLYAASDLRGEIVRNLGTEPVLVEPGIAYVFRHSDDRLRYLSRLYAMPTDVDAAADLLTQLKQFLEQAGRQPTPEEAPELVRDAAALYGRWANAAAVARQLADPRMVESASVRRRIELLMLLAAEHFHGSRRLSSLPPDRVADVRAFYASFKEACQRADWLLWAAGQPDQIRKAVRGSRVGKTTPTALYVHASAENELPTVLRVYAMCADMLTGRPPEANILKLHHDQQAVSFLSYPEFDSDPHPRLATSLFVSLPKLQASFTDWSGRENRPLLHRKEEFVSQSDPRHSRFSRLTRQEVAAGLYDEPALIGTEAGWQKVLQESGRVLRGHRLIKTESL